MFASGAPHGFELIKISDDGGHVFSPKQNGNGRAPYTAPVSADWTTVHNTCARAMTPERLQTLAASLGVSADSLKALGVGWHVEKCVVTFPERDEVDAIIGIATRIENGDKGFLRGGHRGLTIARDFADLPNPILIVEGPSDCSALCTLGLTPIGRPSNKGGLRKLAKRCRDREVLVVGENDQKPDGDWPGRDGAISIAQGLANAWHKPVAWTLPPAGVKDVRAWLNARNLNLSDREVCEAAGRELLAALRANAVEVTSGAAAESHIDVSDIPKMNPVDAAKADNPFPTTDYGNALRFVRWHLGKVRYVNAWKKWLVWTGTHWERDETGAAERLAVQTILKIYSEIPALAAINSDKRSDIIKHAQASQSAGRIAAMLQLAKSEAGIATAVDEMDRDLWLFNCENCTIDLRARKTKPHDPADLITIVAPVAYDPAATCPTWDAHLQTITNGNAESIRYNQQTLGMCLTGDIREQTLPIWWGEGLNGKSTTIEAGREVFGQYAGDAPPSLLTVRTHDEHPTEIADLFGKRLIIASETEEGARLKVQLVKRITGDPTLKGRFMRGDFFEFPRRFKTILITNNRPRIREHTTAVWRRLRLVPFIVVVTNPDKKLSEKLRAERSGILNRFIEGCYDWLDNGITEPKCVTTATKEYREESDSVGEFLTACCELVDKAWTSTADLRASYKAYCEEQSERPVDGKTWGKRLTEAGCVAQKEKGVRGWEGVRLTVVLSQSQAVKSGPTSTAQGRDGQHGQQFRDKCLVRGGLEENLGIDVHAVHAVQNAEDREVFEL